MTERPTSATGQTKGPAGSSTFGPLKNRGFRLYWFGNLATHNGIQMSIVVRGWLVYTLTDNATALGLVAAAFGVPMLLVSLYGGAVADRVRKRNLILLTQTVGFVVLAAVGVLISLEAIKFWHLMVSAFLTGILFAFALPARQALVVELVGSEQMLSAVALGSIGMNLCRIASPALAGVLIKLLGVPGAYWLTVASNLLSVLFTYYLPPGVKPEPRAGVGLGRDLWEGLLFVKNSTVVLVLLTAALVTVVLAMPYQTLMPVFAKTIFQAGETGLGILMSAIGVGALAGSMVVNRFGRFRRQGLVMLISGVSFGLFLVLFAYAPNLPAAFALLSAATFGSSIFFVLTNTLLINNTPREYTGRVMSLFMMTWGLQPVGSLPAAALADRFGAPLAVALGGGAAAVFLLVLTFLPGKVRRLI
jgi:MFS family permease